MKKKSAIEKVKNYQGIPAWAFRIPNRRNRVILTEDQLGDLQKMMRQQWLMSRRR